jgi:hypothetical protein
MITGKQSNRIITLGVESQDQLLQAASFPRFWLKVRERERERDCERTRVPTYYRLQHLILKVKSNLVFKRHCIAWFPEVTT